jgi:L-fuconolactonase
MLIDSHHHLWSYSADQYGWISDAMPELRHDFLLPELRQMAAHSGVDAVVTVQARQTIEETRWLLELAGQEPLIRGVVGWLPLADPGIETLLDSLADQPLLKGVRHVVQDEPDDRFLLGQDFNRGVGHLAGRELVYDLLIYSRQLPASIEFVDAHPRLSIVLDHIAKPTIRSAEFDCQWERDVRELAKREQVCCKFSGLVTEVRESHWSPDTIRRYWDVVIEAFTPRRLMFGSDWPVCLLRAQHTDWVDAVVTLASELSPGEQHELFAGTAIRAYRLQV